MSNARSFLGIFVSIPLFLLLVGTVHAKDVQFSGEVLTELEDPVSLVDTYMDYKKSARNSNVIFKSKKIQDTVSRLNTQFQLGKITNLSSMQLRMVLL